MCVFLSTSCKFSHILASSTHIYVIFAPEAHSKLLCSCNTGEFCCMDLALWRPSFSCPFNLKTSVFRLKDHAVIHVYLHFGKYERAQWTVTQALSVQAAMAKADPYTNHLCAPAPPSNSWLLSGLSLVIRDKSVASQVFDQSFPFLHITPT